MQGKPIPEGWMIDPATGKPLTDPARGNHGLMTPIGGYKGAGLALVIGLLAGSAQRRRLRSRCFSDFNADQGGETNTGQFVVALDIARFMDPKQFAAEIDRHLRDFKASARLPGSTPSGCPGAGADETARAAQPRRRDACARADEAARQLAGGLNIAQLGKR